MDAILEVSGMTFIHIKYHYNTLCKTCFHKSHTIGRAKQGLPTSTQQRGHPRHTRLYLLVQDWANSAADVQQVCGTDVRILSLLKHKDQASAE